MIRAKVAIAFAAGFAVGIFSLAVSYANTFFKTCDNLSDEGFTCSNCMSHTDYKGARKYRFCPICGSFCVRKNSKGDVIANHK